LGVVFAQNSWGQTLVQPVQQDKSYTSFQQLPKIANMDSITKISICGTGEQRRLPDSIFLYKNLVSLELIDFKLKRLPKELRVKNVRLYNNFPSRRLKLSKNSTITNLTIRGDIRGKLPKNYSNLENLEMLLLSRNNLKKFPRLKLGKKVTQLDLSVNNVNVVPSRVKKYKNLKSLNLNANKVNKIKPGIEQLKNLETLSFYRNNLPGLPSMLYEMKSLRVIDLYYNHITEVKKEIANWKNLEILYLSNNEITSIPEEIGELTNLRELYLHHNKISQLPASIAKLTSLGILRFNHNYMKEWPAGVASLTGLMTLDCSYNFFETIPINDFEFQNMRLLSLQGNPWDAELRPYIMAWIKILRENEIVVQIDDNNGIH
jgi:Leucine-rich repeat (LRR) protein